VAQGRVFATVVNSVVCICGYRYSNKSGTVMGWTVTNSMHCSCRGYCLQRCLPFEFYDGCVLFIGPGTVYNTAAAVDVQ
jgi:hypothetical protein